jgi:hypothetical protein
MSNLCPICQREMKKEHRIKHVDYHCFPVRRSHHYALRTTIVGDKIECKIRFKEANGDRIFLKVNYKDNYSEVWGDDGDDAGTDDVSPPPRTRIEQIVDLNFDDLDKLRNKIRTMLVFS